jgi:hypothetical protein
MLAGAGVKNSTEGPAGVPAALERRKQVVTVRPMRFEESLAALAEDLAGTPPAGGWHTLTLDAGRYQADAAASQALLATEPAGAPVLAIAVPVDSEPSLTITF